MKNKKIICSALAGTITMSCFATVPVSADRVATDYIHDGISYFVLDLNRDKKVNARDLTSLSDCILCKSSTVTPTKLKNNQAVDDAKNAVEQYIKTNCKKLVANMDYTRVIGFMDANGKADSDFLAIVTFNRTLSQDELTSLCKYGEATWDNVLAREILDGETEYNHLRIAVTDNQITTVIPSKNDTFKSSVTDCTPKMSAYDINKDGRINVFDTARLRNQLLNGSLTNPTEKSNRYAIQNTAAGQIQSYINAYNTIYNKSLKIQSMQIDALMSESSVVDDDFIVTITLDRGLTGVEMVDFGIDELYLGYPYIGDILANPDDYKIMRISIIDGNIDNIVPCSINASSRTSYYAADDITQAAPETTFFVNNAGAVAANDLAQDVRKMIKKRSGILYAKIADIDCDPATINSNLTATITFNTPLTSDQLWVLCSFDIDTDIDYDGKVTQVNITKNGSDYIIEPILEPFFST